MNYRVLTLLLVLVASSSLVTSQEDPSQPSTSIASNDPDTGTNTVGVVTQLMKLFRPLREVLWMFVDSYLRNTQHEALPCLVTSWIPLKISCTPV